MTKRKWLLVLAAVVLLAVGVGVGVYAAGNYGTQSDPLITKSYLDEVVQPQLEREMQTALQGAIAANDAETGTFRVLELTAGQQLTCPVGTELLLRSGDAAAIGSLADTTAGAAVSAGEALAANHLYMTAEIGAGLAARGSVTLLVSGEYSLATQG